MKTLIIFLLTFFLFQSSHSQSLLGAWENNYTSPEGIALKTIITFTDQYQVLTTYNATTGAFIHTNGGSWTLAGDRLTEITEFNSENPERVGGAISFKIILNEDSLTIVKSNQKFRRLDHGSPGVLQGAWLMSGRIKDGETQSRDTKRPRKTMKILSGTRFQWIAYNTDTKQFMGTGGGTYSTINGEYTENIAFFSKDNSRVGASLQFNYKLKEGNWHHTGYSSKGKPIYEIWSARK